MRIKKVHTIAIVTAMATLLSASSAFACTSTSSGSSMQPQNMFQNCNPGQSFTSGQSARITTQSTIPVQSTRITTQSTILAQPPLTTQAAIPGQSARITTQSVIPGQPARTTTQYSIPVQPPKAQTSKITTGYNVKIKVVLDRLVKNSTITQDQEDAILLAIVKSDSGCTCSSNLNSILNKLVSNSTITQDQEDTIFNAIVYNFQSIIHCNF